MSFNPPFYLQKGNIFALPIFHTNMEMAKAACRLFAYLKPACTAVELPETMELQFLHGASRLPDITIVSTDTFKGDRLYYLMEPCDPIFETLRSSLEKQIPAYCIDLDLDDYPEVRENFPDPYAIEKLGYKQYYELLEKEKKGFYAPQDKLRELHMAKKLKELSLRYDSVLFVGGMFHVKHVLELIDLPKFQVSHSVKREFISMTTPDEGSLRSVMGEFGWISNRYEMNRASLQKGEGENDLDRQKLIFQLYKEASRKYRERQGQEFTGYHLRNTMKFGRNYALTLNRLLPDFYQILTAAKACVDHNFAYEVWELATEYPHYRNVDNLMEETVTPEQLWGHSKMIRFHLRVPSRKAFLDFPKRRDRSKKVAYPPGPFSICSYPPEDLIIENFGNFLQKKGAQILLEESSRTVPFSSSLEDGVDVRETIRHFAEKKLYVKTSGKPKGGVGSVVMIFDEDTSEEGKAYVEKYPWRTTWLGEHTQESDMTLYATFPSANVIGPGISRCEYGGFLMSYPPRRLQDVWGDPDYAECRTKAETLLVAAIDYSLKPVIVYVAAKPPRSKIKSFARRFGKKIVYLPIGQLSPTTLHKLRVFHVLDGHDKRKIASDYIF
jgi:hypothetical protein